MFRTADDWQMEQTQPLSYAAMVEAVTESLEALQLELPTLDDVKKALKALMSEGEQ
jgi:hypothetical protein